MNPPATAPSKDNDSPAFWREQEMLLLQNVMSLVGKSLSPDIVLREILHLMSELLGLNRGRVVLKDPDGETCRIQHAYGLTRTEMERGRYRLDEGVTGHVLTHGQLVLVQDIDREDTFLARAEDVEHGRGQFESARIVRLHASDDVVTDLEQSRMARFA